MHLASSALLPTCHDSCPDLQKCLYYELHEKNWPQRPAEHDARLMNIWLHGATGRVFAVFKVSSILLLKIAAKQAVRSSFISVTQKKKNSEHWSRWLLSASVCQCLPVWALYKGDEEEEVEDTPASQTVCLLEPGFLLSQTFHFLCLVMSVYSLAVAAGWQTHHRSSTCTSQGGEVHKKIISSIFKCETLLLLSYWVGCKKIIIL